MYILISTAALCVRPTLPFKREKCERTYKSKDSLGRHKKICGVKPSFSCSLCDYRTKVKFSLRTHLIHVHGVDRSQLANFGAGDGKYIFYDEAVSLYCYNQVISFEFQLFVLSCLSSATNASAPTKTSVI